MPLVTFEVLSLDTSPLPAPLSHRFDESGGTIGRDATNTFVLPDKHRRVSRLHAAVTFPQGVPTLTNASTSLPIGVREETLDCGQTMQLALGDVLEIGPYLLRVQCVEGSDPQDARTVLLATEAVQFDLPKASAPAPESDPFASLLAGIGSAPPFESGQTGAPRPVAASGLSVDPLAALGFGESPASQPASRQNPPAGITSSAVIPEDFNPFDLPSGTVRNSADPFSALLGAAPAASLVRGAEVSIDSLFANSGTSSFDGLISGAGSPRPSPSGLDSLLANSDSTDPLALFGNTEPARDSGLQVVRDDLAEVSGAFQPPRAFQPAVPVAPPARKAPASAAAQLASPVPPIAADALTQAFLKGARLPLDVLPQGLTPESMFVVGALLRSATSGAVDMLAARTATKLEVQASVTVISAQGNNPLKFLPSGELALQQLLSKRLPGFMRADEAMQDAFDDLRAHEIGVIAGTRAALTEVLGKFDPKVLGDKLAAVSLLESLLPSVRKTKLWEIYLERYAQIRREAEDDFQSIFGRAFVQAYERETVRMKEQKIASGGSV